MSAFRKIIKSLEKNNIPYELKEHPPTYTSKQSAKYRNDPLEIGAKALIIKTNKEFIMCILAAHKKIDSKRLKMALQTSRIRFATKEEIKELTSLAPGSILPFGNLFKLKTFIDKSILKNDFIAFNAGLLTKSIKIKKEDYLKLIDQNFHDFSI